MSARLACLLFALVLVPALNSQTSANGIQTRIERKIDWHDEMASATQAPAELDANVARLHSMQHDAEELSQVNAALQAELQQLRKGFLPKDLDEKLKKMEKLSKKLRRDMEP